MFGLEEIKNVFGPLTIAFVVEVGVAIGGIFIAYKKLQDKIIGSYKDRKKQEDNIKEALEGVRSLPDYKKENKKIHDDLEASDKKILETCEKIQAGVIETVSNLLSCLKENQRILNLRLDKLEERERNALRSKILDQHRLFTNKKKNPMLAWSEMERDSFFHLVKDYESLQGNDYVHSVVIPDMNKLDVIKMSELERLTDMYHSREE